MDRRYFLKASTVLAGAMCLDIPTFGRRNESFGKPLLKVGIISDTHISTEESLEVFRRALVYFRENGVDAVMIAGDITNNSRLSQFKAVAKVWDDVFASWKTPAGRKVEKLFVTGNHDIGKYSPEEMTSIWMNVFGEEWSPVYMKEINGYKFIGAHFDNRETTPGLAGFMDAVRNQLPSDKPFFYFQHTHPKGTCSAPWVWGQDNGETTGILNGFPNVVAFSGHSHTSLTDERTIWQGTFTSVGTSSLSYVIPFDGRENSKRVKNRKVQMPPLDCSNGKQGMLMTVYRESIVLRRHEFVFGENLGEDWVIPLPFSERNRPYSFESRAAVEKAPQFAAGAAVAVSEPYDGHNRNGEDARQVEVLFPAAVSGSLSKTARALDYEVQVELSDADTFKAVYTERVYSEVYFLSEEREKGRDVKCVFPVDKLPSRGSFRFCVRPCGCFGKRGEPIFSEIIDSSIINTK